jgi:prepilin-type N-terminal cleavage/methylation domain-containing protein/prepilin-type processing-associated H-X9-DG protein
MKRTDRHQGVTLVELAVVLSIIGILASLLLMAVQYARESGRRLACQNNLHQFGIAVNNFVGSTKKFPSLRSNRGAKRDPMFQQTAFQTLLPELDIQSEKLHSESSTGPQADKPPLVLRCPSSNQFLGYRFNCGSGVDALPFRNTRRDKTSGILQFYDGITTNEITDGLSNTILVSERISGIGDQRGGEASRRPIAIAVLPNPVDSEEFLQSCQQLSDPYNLATNPGIDWRGFQPIDIAYTHYLRPNDPGWDCQGGFRYQLYTARSYHSEGVNTLKADGSVQWIPSNIDLSVWRALGTAAGGDKSNAD